MPPNAKSRLSRETKKPSPSTLIINALPRHNRQRQSLALPVDKAWYGEDSKKQTSLQNPTKRTCIDPHNHRRRGNIAGNAFMPNIRKPIRMKNADKNSR